MSIEECHRILGIYPGASLDEIKQAYRDLVNVWHPDKYIHNPRLRVKAEEHLKEINKAHEMLIRFYNQLPSRGELPKNHGEGRRQQQERERAEWVRQEFERQRCYREERTRKQREAMERQQEEDQKRREHDASHKVAKLRRAKAFVIAIAVVAAFGIGLRYAISSFESQRSEELTRAALHGDVKAQYDLGILYYRGQGRKQDYAEAAKWWRASAEQGYADAQFNLGVAYLHGRGIGQNYIRAYMWLNLAAAHGDQEATKAREDVAKMMTSAQIAKAKAMARKWKPKKMQ